MDMQDEAPNHDGLPSINPELPAVNPKEQEESCCCTKAVTGAKNMVYKMWHFLFSKVADHERKHWDDNDDQYAHTEGSEMNFQESEDTSTIAVRHHPCESIAFKGDPSEIYKQQEMIYKNIQKSNLKQKKLDVYNLDRSKTFEGGFDGLSDDSGLPQRLIEAIFTTDYISSRMSKGDAARECPICTIAFQEGDEVKILQCLHTYHKKCVDHWLSKKSTCPDCKFNLRTLDLKQFM
jgi:Ring finger domain